MLMNPVKGILLNNMLSSGQLKKYWPSMSKNRYHNTYTIHNTHVDIFKLHRYRAQFCFNMTKNHWFAVVIIKTSLAEQSSTEILTVMYNKFGRNCRGLLEKTDLCFLIHFGMYLEACLGLLFS